MLDSSFDETDNDSVIETTEVHGDHSYKLYRFSWWSYCIKKKKICFWKLYLEQIWHLGMRSWRFLLV